MFHPNRQLLVREQDGIERPSIVATAIALFERRARISGGFTLTSGTGKRDQRSVAVTEVR
jgi:hypothetical protein